MIEDLSRLLDREELSEIFRNFSDLTGLNVSLRDLSGQDIVSFFRDEGDCICKMIGNCEMCLENIRFGANKAAELGEPYIFICGCGLVMCASAVVLEDALIGAVFCGPAMLWDADDYALAELRNNTSRTALTDSDRQRIAQNTPQFSCEQITSASRILFRLVNYMCRSRNDVLLQRQKIMSQQATISVLLAESKQLAPSRQGFYSQENEKRLLNSVRLGDRQAATKILNSILTDIFLYSGGKLSAIQAKLFELSGFLFRTASEAGAPEDELIKIAQEAQRILDSGLSFEDLCYQTSRILEKYSDAIYKSGPRIAGIRYLRAASTYLLEHFTQDISLASVAEAIGISASYLSHLFKSGLSVTFTEYLAGIRVDFAKQLLQNGEAPVSDIARRVGYEDVNYFIRIFKKTIGLTPKQYRQLTGANSGTVGQKYLMKGKFV
ncbi:MAG TPA: PocR ligand-binding domain-containing protein [Candidatus Pullichristensenella excrementigallinarum]|uniref:PocR ligand-binding domain-containing protein n=1 Tax=Candidatus Pullichristensenella excrementigallinarum TaxID=2840907 RepID=A0A9D1LCZ9_9FIRM|nr:PocR ligand-binding domain-containing protein [Candidatus Pullichristensenella excrementigallinarum]